MKRVYLALLCVLALLLAGCTDINQNNSFVGQPTAETQTQTEVPEMPDATLPPAAEIQPVVTPEAALAPAGEQMLNPSPQTPLPTNTPDATEPVPESPAPENGFNG